MTGRTLDSSQQAPHSDCHLGLCVTRRELLAAGAVGIASLPVAASAALASVHSSPKPHAHAVILLWMDGGPSHLETFDPKPGAGADYRSGIGAVRSAVPGVAISELFPRMARSLRHCCVVRGIAHAEHAHDRASHLLMTGRDPDGDRVRPSIGSLVARALHGDHFPAYVTLARGRFASDYAGRGELCRCFGPVPLPLPDPCGPETLPQAGPLAAVRAAADPSHEPAHVRERYGRQSFGRGCLAARRLVEMGVRFVTVSQGGWDMHCDLARSLAGSAAPQVDQGMSALIEDLAVRGLLNSTIVVWLGEFGRSPRMNALAGRDHWPHSACAVLAGANVPRGAVIGATDAIGAHPLERAIRPSELAATILAKLGIRGALPAASPIADLG